MAHYLIEAKLKKGIHKALRRKLKQEAFKALQPFGRALTYSLKNARKREDGTIVWEEEDYCTPPLKEEQEAVLDTYFEKIHCERVSQGEGWSKINQLPKLFPDLVNKDK